MIWLPVLVCQRWREERQRDIEVGKRRGRKEGKIDVWNANKSMHRAIHIHCLFCAICAYINIVEMYINYVLSSFITYKYSST